MSRHRKTSNIKPRAEVPLIGREREQRLLAHAVQGGTLPQVLLFDGNAGIGKARLAGWLASTLVCDTSRDGRACEKCPSCRLARSLSHPDIHWIFPHGSPGNVDLEQQITAIEGFTEAATEARRVDALHTGAAPDERYYLATVRWIRRLVSRKPSMSPRQVLILTEIERIMMGEDTAGPAINALLKTLEEPPATTYFFLTCSATHLLPGTVRSRIAIFRVPPMTDEDVRTLLRAAYDTASAEIDSAARFSRGSPSIARRRLDSSWLQLRNRAIELAEIALAGDAVRRYAAIRDQGFKGARTDFRTLLSEIENVAIEAAEAASDPKLEIAPELRPLVERFPFTEDWLALARRAAHGLRLAAANVSPMLILHDTLLMTDRV